MTVETEKVEGTVIADESGEAGDVLVIELPNESEGETIIETENSDAVVVASIEAEAEVAIAEIEASVEIARIEAATEREISWQEHNEEIAKLQTTLKARELEIAELRASLSPVEADLSTLQVSEAELPEADPMISTPQSIAGETSETPTEAILESGDENPVLEILPPTRRKRRLI